MNYAYHRIKAWQHEVIRERDQKVVAFLVKGAPGHWHIVSADSDDVLVQDVGAYIEDAKEAFLAYAKRRRGHL